MSTFINTFKNLLELNSIEIPSNDILSLYENLYIALTETNKQFNLTAVTSEEGVCGLHFVDSMMLLPYIPSNVKLIDIGTGAGFPSLPIAISRKDVAVLGVDSTAKKVEFSSNFAKTNGLSNFASLSARAEDLGNGDLREKYDIVTARAVARLNVLSELTLPLIKVGGEFIAMKGASGREEAKEAEKGIQKLGCEIVTIEDKELILPNEKQSRTFIKIKKVSNTPKEFPRSFGKIKKKPL